MFHIPWVNNCLSPFAVNKQHKWPLRSGGHLCRYVTLPGVPLRAQRRIDHFKVNAAMSPGVQTYWDERAAKH